MSTLYRVEKTKNYTVISNHHLKDSNLTLKSKGLLSLMLSLPESWDYSTRGLAEICKEGVDSIGGALKELEDNGYIARNQLRDEKGKIRDIEYVIYEIPQVHPDEENPKIKKSKKIKKEKLNDSENNSDAASPYMDYPDTGNPDTDNPDTEKPAQLNIDIINKLNKSKKEKEKTNEININPSINPIINQENRQKNTTPPPNPQVERELIDTYTAKIKKNIEYGILCQRYGSERIDGVVNLMLEFICSSRDYIDVAGDRFPAELVKQRIWRIDCSNIEYVFGCMDRTTAKIYNIRNYLRSALYNAGATQDNYYRAEVNHDLYGK